MGGVFPKAAVTLLLLLLGLVGGLPRSEAFARFLEISTNPVALLVGATDYGGHVVFFDKVAVGGRHFHWAFNLAGDDFYAASDEAYFRYYFQREGTAYPVYFHLGAITTVLSVATGESASARGVVGGAGVNLVWARFFFLDLAVEAVLVDTVSLNGESYPALSSNYAVRTGLVF